MHKTKIKKERKKKKSHKGKSCMAWNRRQKRLIWQRAFSLVYDASVPVHPPPY
jgi:hypothetical protein